MNRSQATATSTSLFTLYFLMSSQTPLTAELSIKHIHQSTHSDALMLKDHL